jgi:hypothetical protein
MLIREAVAHLDGHAILSANAAKEVCQTLDIPFNDQLLLRWQNREEAWNTYGFVATAQGAGEGVDGLDLSYHVAEHLGLGRPGAAFGGKGYQARANQQAIRRKLSELGKL